MRYSKGKYVFSNKEVYGVEVTLNKVILGYLEKLHDSLSKSACHGVPMRYLEQQAKIDGIENTYEADVDKADVLYMKDIEELIWVFSDNEPDISKYNFSYDFGNDIPGGLKCSNPEESERYSKDMNEYSERKLAGYKLFGEIYNDLSW